MARQNLQTQDIPAPPKRRIHRVPTCPPGYITEPELARRLGKHTVTVQRERLAGNCSPYVKRGITVFYNEAAFAKRFAAAEIDPSSPKKLSRRRKA